MQTFDIKRFLDNLQAELKLPLPGFEAQLKMVPPMRLKMSLDIPENVKNGAVLLMLYLKNDNLTISFIKRALDGGVHSGQIGFPGGKKDESDTDLTETALRETKEEIGIIPGIVQILGKLTELYIPVSNYIVYPFVGYYPEKPGFNINKSEVDEIVEIPLNYLMNPENCGLSEIMVNRSVMEVPCYLPEKNKIWGATAMILSEFIQILEKVYSGLK